MRKYHHPIFTDNHYDPDAELFELLPRIAKATSTERNRILSAWIAHFGSYDTTRNVMNPSPPTQSASNSTPIFLGFVTERLGKDLSAHLIRLRGWDRKWNYYVSNGCVWRHTILNFNEKDIREYRIPDYGYHRFSSFPGFGIWWNISFRPGPSDRQELERR